MWLHFRGKQCVMWDLGSPGSGKHVQWSFQTTMFRPWHWMVCGKSQSYSAEMSTRCTVR